jgi:hypothetical protein
MMSPKKMIFCFESVQGLSRDLTDCSGCGVLIL